MSRKFEDVVEAEVRRRYADLLASAGVDSGRLSLELLYLLPEEFVREYTELFFEALREDLPGTNAGGQVPKKKTGTVSDRKVGTNPNGGTTRGAASGGKKYKTHWLVKSELALEVKRRVDRKLVRLIGSTRSDVKAAMSDSHARTRTERGSGGKWKGGK